MDTRRDRCRHPADQFAPLMYQIGFGSDLEAFGEQVGRGPGIRDAAIVGNEASEDLRAPERGHAEITGDGAMQVIRQSASASG
jgi:hypothetical protein